MLRVRSVLPRIALALLLASAASAQDRWELRFFHDVLDENFTIMDLAFPSPQRGIAVGYLSQDNGRVKPMAVATSDGGRTWDPVDIDDEGMSLFFVDDTVGWMVSDGALWKTVEAGRSWRKISGKDDFIRVAFLDENHGWAVGRRKQVWSTTDGGETWTPLAAAAEPATTPEYTNYIWIDLVPPGRITIVGYSEPPRHHRFWFLPDWMDPEATADEREIPTSTLLLQSVDAGGTWESTVVSMFGRMIRFRLRPDGRGLSLVRFEHRFEWPSEVYRVDSAAGKTERTFRREDRAITDVALTPDGGAWLAGYEPVGTLPDSPIPGKLVALHSNDLEHWEETEIDYRAQARRAVLATVDSDVWIATDTGMILKWVPSGE